MGLRNFINQRKLSYSLAGAMVMAVNGNAIHAPARAFIEYSLSKRPSQVVQYGQWDIVEKDSPVNSIHAALLHTGKVLIISGSGNNEKQFDAKTFRTVIWDPDTNEFKDVATPWDAFCAGHVFLPDGKLLVAGGTKGYEDLERTPKLEYQGLKDSYIFDPVTETYEKVDDLDHARWYPTLVSLPNGDVLASSGLDENGEILQGQTEIFDIETKQWEERKDLNRYFPTYPSLLLTAEGTLFYSGSNSGYGSATLGRTPGFWDLMDNTFRPVKGLNYELLETSATVMLPPAQDQKVMVLGGGGIGDSPLTTDRTAIIDLDSPDASFVLGPPLKEAVRYPNAVILPDDTVLSTGGSREYRANDALVATIYHPDTNTFTDAASPRVGRNYHAEALLLPDGRVATFGSDPLGGTFEMRIEVYSPAYLFRGPRPKVLGGSSKLERGTRHNFHTTTPSDVYTAKLLRPSSVTHVTDVEQRSISLPFKTTGNGIEVTIPENRNLVPSGWYMLFITDKKSVPSTAYWVHVK